MPVVTILLILLLLVCVRIVYLGWVSSHLSLEMSPDEVAAIEPMNNDPEFWL